jgi:hypothetical protein
MAKVSESRTKSSPQRAKNKSELDREIDIPDSLYDKGGQIKNFDKILDLLKKSEPTNLEIPKKYLDSEAKILENIKKSSQVSQRYMQTEINLQR